MNRDEFAETLGRRAGITKSAASQIINLIFDGDDGILARELHKLDGKVALSGFGVLESRTLRARTGRNPATGDALDLPAKRVVRFKPGSNLKTKIASKPPRESDANPPEAPAK
jgi:DNA-binding protein HU-beta